MMNSTQQKAFDIYYESATIQNGFTPVSFVELAKKLNKLGLKGSRSSVARWAIKFDWKSKLNQKVDLVLVEDETVQNLIEVSSQKSATQKTIDDFVANENLKSDSYIILKAQMLRYSEKLEQGLYLTHLEERFVLKVLELTSNREDKLLDRQALLSATKLTNSEDVLKALNEETIEIEIDDE